MNWYKQSQQIIYGYKAVGFKDGQAYSLFKKEMKIDITIGNIIVAPASSQGIFLGSSKQYVLDYYSGLTDDKELMLTYTVRPEDILAGSPNPQNTCDHEMRVKKAKLIQINTIKEAGNELV